MDDKDFFEDIRRGIINAITTDNQGRKWQTIPRGRARPKNKLTYEQKQEIREAIIEDNKRIEHERTHVFILAKRHPSLRPSVLAARYKVTYSQIKTAMKGLE